MPYVASYLRNVTGETSVQYSQMLWTGNSMWLIFSIATPVLGLIETRVPKPLYFFVGIALFG